MRASRAFSPPRLALTTLLLTFVTDTSSLTQKHLVCKQPGTQACFTWLINWEDFIRDINEIQSKTNLIDYCGISNLKDFAKFQKFFKIKTQLINEPLTKTIICKRVISYDLMSEWSEVARTLGNALRFRRQDFKPRGRYRGQTQSQYLAIDRGNGKDEGKAEAHSAADTSRASVSGNSGMGQAQSQSVYDPNCDDCYGRSAHEVENLKRTSGSRPGAIGSVWPNGQGPNYKENGGFNPISTGYPGSVSSGGNGRPDGSYRPNGPIGVPDFSPNAANGGYTPGGNVQGPTGLGAYDPGRNVQGPTGIGAYDPGRNVQGPTGIGAYGPGGNVQGPTGIGAYGPGGNVQGPTGIGAYGPGVTNGDGRGMGSYNPSTAIGKNGYIPSGKTGVAYRPDGTGEVEGYSPIGSAPGSFNPMDTTRPGGYTPSRTIGDSGYTPNEGIGNTGYTSNGPAGPGGYLPNGKTGGYVPSGHYTPNVDGGVGSYAPSGSIGGGGYNPSGPVNSGGYLPSGTVGTGRYFPSRTDGVGGYTPTGNVGDGKYTPSGSVGVGGYPPTGNVGDGKYTPSGTSGGGYTPTGGSGSYSPTGTTGDYKPTGTVGAGGYNPTTGGYKPSETSDNRNYRPIGTTRDSGYSPSGIGGYNPNVLTGNERPGNNLSPEFIRAPGKGQTGVVNWPIASGPYPGPGGNSYFCCVVPNNGMGILPTNYGTGSGGPSSPAGNSLAGGQYTGPGVQNNLMSPQTNLETNGSGRPTGTIPYGIGISQNQPGFYGSDGSNGPIRQSGTNVAGGPEYGVNGGYPGPYGADTVGGGKPYGTSGQFGKNIPGFGTVIGPGSDSNGVNAPGGSFETGTAGGPNVPGVIYGAQNTGKTDGPRNKFEVGVPNGPNGGIGDANLPNAGTGIGNGQNASPGQYGTHIPDRSDKQNGFYGTPGGLNSPGSQIETGYPDGTQNHYGSGIHNGQNNPASQYENGPNGKNHIGNYGSDNLGIGSNGLYRPGGTGPIGNVGTYGTGTMGRPVVPGEQYETGPYSTSGPGGSNIAQGHYGKDPTGRPYDSGISEIPNGVYGGMVGGPNSNVNPKISGGSNNLPINNFGTSVNGQGPGGSTTNMAPNGLFYDPQEVPTNNGGQFGNIPFNFSNQRIPVRQNNEYSGIPQNYLDPNSIAVDGDDSEAEASVAQAANGTSASASSKGGNDKGRAQTNVHGTYTGSGSFQAQAQITGENKDAQSEVSGGKKGASSSASGSGRNNKSQANVQLGSETGSVQTQSQSNGVMHSSNSQVQGSVKGGMADAQARGPGSTSSQAQIGFTPFKDKDKSLHDTQQIPFVGGGIASAQSTGRTGQSQSQLHGTFKYGITYNGAAQSGASQDKDAVFPNRLSFDKIDVFDKKDKNIDVDSTEKSQYLATDRPPTETSTLLESSPSDLSSFKSKVTGDETSTEYLTEETMKNSESIYSSHTHLDHHKTPSENQDIPNGPTLIGNRRSFNANYDSNTDYEYTTDKDENQPDIYDTDMGFDTDVNNASEAEQNDYSNYEEFTSDSPTHESYLSPNKKGLDVQQTLGGNSQKIVLGSLKNHNAEITQKNSDRPDEKKVYQPGERVPGTGGYTIPIGFTGSVKSVASKDKTYVVGSKDSPSQAQTVKLTPGTGKIKYTHPYAKYVKPKDLRSLQSPKENDRYVSVSKSVTRALDDDNNIRKQYMHTYYTKSSSCGYFTFTCTMVSSAEGRKKVCKPKIPTNPDGTPIRC